MTKKLRAQQIIIDLPKESEDAWIHVMVQEVQRDDDGKVTNIIPRQDFIHKTGAEIGMDAYTYFDPVLQKESVISGYGLQYAITTAILLWMKEHEGGEIINNDLILGE